MAGFPAFRYHAKLAPQGYLFKSQAELDSAGPGWVDSPAKFGVVTHPPVQVPGTPAVPAVENAENAENDKTTHSKLSLSAKTAQRMNKPELYGLARRLGLEVPEDIETITRKELLALVLPYLSEES